MDDNLPPMTSDLPPPGDKSSFDKDAALPVSQSVSLMPDQLASLGLGDCKPGSSYTVQLKAGDKDGDGPDAGQTFDVVSSEPSGDDDAGGDEISDKVGDSDAPPTLAEELASSKPPEEDDDVSALGYKRNVKPPRIGLPDTKNMRNL